MAKRKPILQNGITNITNITSGTYVTNNMCSITIILIPHEAAVLGCLSAPTTAIPQGVLLVMRHDIFQLLMEVERYLLDYPVIYFFFSSNRKAKVYIPRAQRVLCPHPLQYLQMSCTCSTPARIIIP